jgi:L-asparaginase II
MQSEILVHVKRGNIVECAHRGNIAVVDYKGNILAAAGNPNHVTYARSTVKPLQALPLLESGAAKRFKLTDEEIAVVCASHSGQDIHVLDVGFIQCGPHAPFHKVTAQEMREKGEKPTSLHNNCSGKHSGMLALGQHLEANLAVYLDLHNPIQQRMQKTIAEMCGMSPDQMETGVDGCGVPVFAMPMNKLAYAMARLGCSNELPSSRAEHCRRIISSIQRYPTHLAGENRFDTELMKLTDSKIIAKSGAEGIFALIMPERKASIVIKLEDGGNRGVFPTVVETLKQLKWIEPALLEQLKSFHQPENVNWAGTKVGEIRSVFQLQING